MSMALQKCVYRGESLPPSLIKNVDQSTPHPGDVEPHDALGQNIILPLPIYETTLQFLQSTR